jgi:hypothetical protein
MAKPPARKPSYKALSGGTSQTKPRPDKAGVNTLFKPKELKIALRAEVREPIYFSLRIL